MGAWNQIQKVADNTLLPLQIKKAVPGSFSTLSKAHGRFLIIRFSVEF